VTATEEPPILLASNRPADRFYRGGAAISRFRGEPPAGPREPEDWIASTTTVAGETSVGLTTLPGGVLLRDAIAADPVGWLGHAHVERWGGDSRLLVKLLDAGQRLPVHAHPHDDFAAAHLGAAHGKAEAWCILRGGTVHLGLRDDVDDASLAALVDGQRADELLGLLHEVPVSPGDVVWVPPGELHAIGEGVLLLELQQPEDLSVLLEWRGFAIDGARSGHLGLGFGLALQAVNRRGRDADGIRSLLRRATPGGAALPPDAAPYFRLDRVTVQGSARIAAGFAVLVVTDGALRTSGGVALPAGTTALRRAASGPLEVEGEAEALVCRPPEP